MRRTGRFYPIEEFKDKRKKLDRIKQGLSGPASNGALYVRKSQTAFISQFIHFPGKNPDGTHDDVIETVIEKKGKVIIVENGKLQDFEGISMILRYW